MNEKQDIREYSDSELSLLVFNDEGLYSRRHDDDFIGLVTCMFTFRPEQLSELLNDLKSDLEETQGQ